MKLLNKHGYDIRIVGTNDLINIKINNATLQRGDYDDEDSSYSSDDEDTESLEYIKTPDGEKLCPREKENIKLATCSPAKMA